LIRTGTRSKRNSARRRLICKVYEGDPMIRPNCGAEMSVCHVSGAGRKFMSAITDPSEGKILIKGTTK